MGQVIIYVLADPVLARLWPDMRITPESLDRIADHITDFSLAYLRQAAVCNSKRQRPQEGGNGNGAGSN
jgi:hypothetical protein